MPHLIADLEHQLSMLVRTARARVASASGGSDLERSSYAILCLLADEGPQRIGRIAQSFDLDPSTVTRQVQAVVRLGLARRTQDVSDRRATILDLTETGLSTVTEVRESRRCALRALLTEWPEADQTEFLRLLGRFNDDVAEMIQQYGERRED